MDFISKEPINKGWSGDKKFCVTDKDGKKYLLRISPADRYDARKRDFELMKQVESMGIDMCRPIEFGSCAEGVYSVQSFIDGTDAEESMSTVSAAAQY